MDLLARIEVDGVCLGGIRLSGVLRPKQVASVGAQTKTRAWAFRLGSSCASGVSHARCKWLPATCSPYHTSIRARLATPVRSLLPVTSNILPTKNTKLAANLGCLSILGRSPSPLSSNWRADKSLSCRFVSGFRPAFVSRHGGGPNGRTRRGAAGGGARLRARRRFDADESRNAIAAMEDFRGRASAPDIPAMALQKSLPLHKSLVAPQEQPHSPP